MAMISWAAISSSTKRARLVKVAEEAEEADPGEVVVDVAATAVVAEEADRAEVVADVAEVAEAGTAVIAVVTAAEAEEGAGKRPATIKIENETGERTNAPRFHFAPISSLPNFRFCSMLSLGKPYGYTIRRKRPERAL
jgi:hypothetical protein